MTHKAGRLQPDKEIELTPWQESGLLEMTDRAGFPAVSLFDGGSFSLRVECRGIPKREWIALRQVVTTYLLSWTFGCWSQETANSYQVAGLLVPEVTSGPFAPRASAISASRFWPAWIRSCRSARRRWVVCHSRIEDRFDEVAELGRLNHDDHR